jgi:hypothetical protein
VGAEKLFGIKVNDLLISLFQHLLKLVASLRHQDSWPFLAALHHFERGLHFNKLFDPHHLLKLLSLGGHPPRKQLNQLEHKFIVVALILRCFEPTVH